MKAVPTLILMVLVVAVATPALAGSVDYEAMKLAYSLQLDKSVVVVIHGAYYGTGWWVSKSYVITAAHVVGYASGITVELLHGTWRSSGIVIGVDRKHDIAVIRVANPMPGAKILAIANEVRKGMEIIVIGYPNELYKLTGSIEVMSNNPRASFGHIDWVDSERGIFEIGAKTDTGNSGGPVLERNSLAVVGLVSFALPGDVAPWMYYATLSKYIVEDLRKWGVPFRVVDVTKVSEYGTLGLGTQVSKEKVIIAAAGGLAALLVGIIIGMSVRGGRR